MLIIFFILGSIIGSFMACLSSRRLTNLKNSRSICLDCKNSLKPADLIPILSYLYLKGKCRYCGCSIPKTAPCSEIVYALIFAICYLHWQSKPLELLFWIILISLLLLMSLDDLTSLYVFDADLIIFLFLSIISCFIYPETSLVLRLLGTLIVLIPVLFCYLIFPNGIGFGDIIFISVAGFLLALEYSVLSFLIATFTACLYAFYLILCKQATNKTAIPLIPFLSLGIIITALIKF